MDKRSLLPGIPTFSLEVKQYLYSRIIMMIMKHNNKGRIAFFAVQMKQLFFSMIADT
jgi:hypothetical protein